jgi:prepilin peptidase CpaA
MTRRDVITERLVQLDTFHLISSILIVLGAGIALVAALHDLAARTVPNGMAAALALTGLAARIADGTFLFALLSGLAVFMAAAFCWRRGWMGGGDVKLLGAAATIVPPHAVFAMLACVAFAGGALALLYLIGSKIVPAAASKGVRPGRPSTFLARVLRAERWRIRRGGPLPYACAIAAGVVITLLRTGA